MKNFLYRQLIITMRVMLITAVLFQQNVTGVEAQRVSTNISPKIDVLETSSLDFQSYIADSQLRDELVKVITSRPSNILPGNRFVIGSEYSQENWSLISIFDIDGEYCLEESNNSQLCSATVFAQKNGSEWEVEFASTEHFSALLKAVSPKYLTNEAKIALDPLRPATIQATTSQKYLFPFEGSWAYWQGWHQAAGPYAAIDIGTNGPDYTVLASAGGTLKILCKSSIGAVLSINDGSNILTYRHLDAKKLGKDLEGNDFHDGSPVAQGTRLGELLLGSPGGRPDGCGNGYMDQQNYRGHIHWIIPKRITIEGWTITYPDTAFRKGDNSLVPEPPQNWGNPKLVSSNHIYLCPPFSNDKIILYQNTDYKCGGQGEGVGYKEYGNLSDGQLLQVPSTLKASSISIPAGWHVNLQKLWTKLDDVYLVSSLRCESDHSFLLDYTFTFHLYSYFFPHFHTDPVNDNVSAIEVKKGSCTNDSPPNGPPNDPSLSSPTNESSWAPIANQSNRTEATGVATSTGVTAAINIAPTLVWENKGDPNSDEISFYVEVIGDDRTINSGWIESTVWQPSQLNYQYGGYQWHVKARDGRGAESDWSETWTFSIQSPNKPPSISFSSANGNSFSSGTIYTRATDWTFTGTASDPEGQLNRVEWRCSGDGCGSQTTHSGTDSWTHTQNSMSGRNNVYFVAYDGYVVNNPNGQSTTSRHLDLRIDLAAPTTTPSMNGQSNAVQWPVWFTAPVLVNLHATDNGTGNATVGMVNASLGSGKIHYRLDNGAWQVVSGSDVNFTVSTDGSHTLEYYSEDALGNTEASRSSSFQIDQTPPSLPANLQETHGLVSDQWQKDQNIPAFTWDAATDAISGVRGYQFYFGDDPGGIGYRNILASEPRQWMPFPAGLPTGTSYLRTRTQDNAGNWSDWATLYIFRYDGTPPENPSEVTHLSGITTAWQNTSNVANFSWPAAHDEGSGINGYYVYWGHQLDGTSSAFISANTYQDLASLCAANAACTGYLRLRSVDKVGNLAEDWNTVFILRYDNAPPVVDFLFNGGATETAQSQVTLDVTSSDQGSGVYAARFSADGQTWTDWEQPVVKRLWNIPPISRQSWPVYAQVKDHVGLISEIAQHEIYLDVNPAQTSSLNFRLFDHGLSGGSGPYTSANYNGRGTLSQTTNAPVVSSAHYTLSNGYEAGSQAIPLIVPGHEEYTYLQGIFASGAMANSLQSASYRMILSVGGIGLSSTSTIGSGHYQHQPGFLAAVQLQQPTEPSDTEQPIVPPPAPEPVLTCDTPSVSINNGQTYTDGPNVNLSLCAPYAVEMMLSTQADFAGAVWEPFASTTSWVIPTTGSTVESHFVYAQFKETNGKVHATYFDDILYDPNRPNGTLLLSDDIIPQAPQTGMSQRDSLSVSGPTILQAASDGSVALYVDGNDDNSGIAEMQLSTDPTFTSAIWQPFSPVVSYMPGGEEGPTTVYARFQDEAGNLSGTAVVNFIYDTQPPAGYIYVNPAVLPGDADTTTLYLGDYGDWAEYYEGETPPAPSFEGGAVEMRLGSDPDFINVLWQPLAESVTIAIAPAQPEGSFYVQYRDAGENISEVYDTTYQIDTIAPDLSAAAEPGEGATRTVNIYANDDLAGIANLYLSNDPLMQQDVITLDYTDTLTWTFDDSKVVWIVAEDGVGNRTEPYPVYATDIILTISGNVGVAGATLSFADGSDQTVTSDSDGNYYLLVPSGWSGAVTPSKTDYTFSPASRDYSNVTEDKTNENYSASQNEYTLMINSAHGTVAKNPNQATYHEGDVVQLTATPDTGWNFANWTGDLTSSVNPSSVTIHGNTSVTVNYTQNGYTLIVASAHGTVARNPDQATYYEGDVVQLAVTPDTGWSFANWTGGLTGTANPGSVTIHGNTSVTANYTVDNQAPTDLALSNSSVAENQAGGTTVGTFTSTDPDAGNAFTYSLVSGAGGADIAAFTISSNSLQTAYPFNATVKNSYSIRVRTTDQGGFYLEKAFTITVMDQTAIFADVPDTYWANSFIERLYNAGITGGCSLVPLMYCPETNVTRAQMAVFLLRGMHGSAYTPPAVGLSTGFTDVPNNYWAAAWIKQLAAEGITGGCGVGLYCPETPVTRDQMAVFLLRAKYGSSYSPPPVTGVFSDVPTDHWAAAWIEQLAAEGITGGCGAGIYCPATPVTRAQMAVFLVRTFGLP